MQPGAGALVLAAGLCGAAAQTLAVWASSTAGLLAALALFAAGGYALARLDRRRPEPLAPESLGADPPRPRAGIVWVGGLAAAVVLAALACLPSDVELVRWQVAAHGLAVAMIVCLAFARDRCTAAPPSRLQTADLAALLLVTAVAAAFRLHDLEAIPPILWHDEVLYLQDAMGMLREGLLSPYASGEWGAPLLHAYTIALSVLLVDDRTTALRLVSVVPGTLAVALLHLALLELFGRRFAVAGAALMAVSAWPVLQSRHGYVWAASIFAIALALYGLARGLRTARLLPFALGGLGLGIGVFYSYAAALMPAAVALFTAYLLAVRAPLVRRRLAGLLFAAAVAAVVAAPRLASLAAHPELRGYQQAALLWTNAPALPLGAILDQLLQAGMSFNRRADDWEQFLPQAMGPILDPISAAAFGLGVFWALFSWRRAGAVLLLVTFGVMLLPSAVAVSLTGWATSWRACGVVPALFGLAGAPFAVAAGALATRTARAAGIAAAAAAGCVVLFVNIHAYFVHHPRKASWRSGSSAMQYEAARQVLAAPAGVRVIVGGLLEHPYVNTLAGGRRDYEAFHWPDQGLLPDLGGERRPALVIARRLQLWEDDVAPEAFLVDLLEHRHPGGRREDVIGIDGRPMLATYLLAADAVDDSAVALRPPPDWGVRRRTRSLLAGEIEDRLPVLWTLDPGRATTVDADAEIDWCVDFEVGPAGTYTLLFRSVAPTTARIDDETLLWKARAWPAWQRVRVDLDGGPHRLWMRSEAPADPAVQIFLVGPDFEPRLFGGPGTRPCAP